MDICDVLVVGGGPAGATCAGVLVRAGFDVLVTDRARFPRDKPCAGWITPQVVRTLGLDLEDYRRNHVLQPFTAFRTGLVGGRPVETTYAEPVSYGIRRCEFDEYLLRRSGARVQTDTATRALRRDGRWWVVDDRVRARILVGAGGHFCPVARHLNRHTRDEPIVTARELEIRLDSGQQQRCGVAPTCPHLYFHPDLRGYGWCVRKGDHLNVGIGRAGRDLARHVSPFLAFAKAAGCVPEELTDRWPGHAYRLYGAASRRLVGDAVLLVGDAAGLAYAASGEGIRPAVESGLLAARAILAARRSARADDLSSYLVALRQRFGRAAGSPAWTALVPAPLARTAAAWLLATPWLTRRLVLDRWFLHAAQPALEPVV